MSRARASKAKIRALLASAEPIIRPPPEDIVVQAPPQGFVKADLRNTRAWKPRMVELDAMGDSVAEIAAFDDYAEVFGSLTPAAVHVAQAFDAAHRWSRLRHANEAWAHYLATQEGLAWRRTRPVLARFKASYHLAVQNDPALALRFPALHRLCTFGKVNARKAVATRARAKKAAEAASEVSSSEATSTEPAT